MTRYDRSFCRENKKVTLLLVVVAVAGVNVGCGTILTEQTETDSSLSQAILPGSAEAGALLTLVNDSDTDFARLDVEIGLDRRAASAIVATRQGADGRLGSVDDRTIEDLAELDALPYVGDSAINKLFTYAKKHGYYQIGKQSLLTIQTLKFINSADASKELLDSAEGVGLDSRAAAAIAAFKLGDDGIALSDDDGHFATTNAIQALSYVGAVAFSKIESYALNWHPEQAIFVVFSPSDYEDSHLAQIITWIDSAETSLDIAMYNLSDGPIFSALNRAHERGVTIRIVSDNANNDRKLQGDALKNSKSARMEKAGSNVRYVNKIMHHKFAIIDGPKHALSPAASTRIITGSGNWSWGAATRYDENTVFISGQIELALKLQNEFEYLWRHSRDFVFDSAKEFELPVLALAPDINIMTSDSIEPHFTSTNFSVNGDTFRKKSGENNTVSDALVNAILDAKNSIFIASGHLRSRPIADALNYVLSNRPEVEVKLYLDQQEFISEEKHDELVEKASECIADAGESEAQKRICFDKGFYFSFPLENAGANVRYKYYAYRWHYSYAKQMHHKYVIIDESLLFTGSYNLSDNAEHNTFENMIAFSGSAFAPLVKRYVENFGAIWQTGNDGRYQALWDELEQSSIPLVYAPMALARSEIEALQQKIRNACHLIGSDDFRRYPEDHYRCETE